MRTTFFAGSLVLLALVVFPAFGQSSGDTAGIADLSAQLDSAVAAKAEAVNLLNYVAEAAPPVKKELNIWDEQIMVLQREVALRDAKLQHHNEDAAVVNEKVRVHNAGCTGTLPKPQYDRCKGEEPYLGSQIGRINTNKAQLDKEAADLKRRGDPIIDRHRELSAKMDKFKADLARAEAMLTDAQARINAATARLRAACKDNRTREAAVHCGQVNWDGAPRDVAPPPADPVWRTPAGPVAPSR